MGTGRLGMNGVVVPQHAVPVKEEDLANVQTPRRNMEGMTVWYPDQVTRKIQIVTNPIAQVRY